MKTIQKRVKFSKGEINPLLDDRTDISLLDESASYIKNYIPTIYGGLRTRQGTREIDILKTFNPIDNKDIKYITYIGGDVSNGINNFISNNLGAGNGELIRITTNETLNYFSINNIRLKKRVEAIIIPNVVFVDASTNYWALDHFTIINPGNGYKDGVYNIRFNLYNYFQYDKPIGQCVIQNGKVIQANVINRGRDYTDHAPNIEAKIDLSAENKTILKISLLNSSGNKINYQDIEISEQENKSVSFINNGIDIKGFVIEKNNNDQINTNLLIKSCFIGNSFTYIKQGKLTRFNYGDEFIFVLVPGYILIYNNDFLFSALKSDVITADRLNTIKTTQAENKLIITHSDFKPLVVEYKNNNFNIFNLDLINIPYTTYTRDNIQNITGITLTPSADSGSISITSNAGFFTGFSLGQIIDGNGGRLRITKIESSIKIYGYTIIPFYTKDPFSNWQYITGYEPTWSDSRGWPITCLYYQQRLFFGGSKLKPTGLWGSRVGQINDFNNIGNYDNDAIDVELSSKDNARIVNLYGNRGLQIFTETGEFIAREGTLTPKDFFSTQTSSVGNDLKTSICDVAGTTLFIDRKGLNINTFVYNEEVASYNSQALTLLNNQLLNKPVAFDIDYNSSFEDGNFVFLVNSDGTAITINILLDQAINSATRFLINSCKILDVIVLKNKTYFLAKKDDLVYLLKLDNVKTDLTKELFIYNNEITGLDFFNNQLLRVYDEENDYGVYQVVNGVINIQQPDKNVFVGLDINCELISNDIAVGGQTNNIKSRLAKAVITTTNKTDKINFNGKTPLPQKTEYDNIFNVLSAGNWGTKNKFIIKSVFDFLELKSIVLIINYGR